MKLLADENISPLTIEFLREEGYDTEAVRERRMGADDAEVVEIAEEEERTIITQDKDFGEIYYFQSREELKVMVVRPQVQTVENVNSILGQHLGKIREEDFGLYIISENRVWTRK